MLLGLIVGSASAVVAVRALDPGSRQPDQRAAAVQGPQPAGGDTGTSGNDISNLAGSGVDQLRSVAKWMIAAFAAIASLMLAGIQLTSLGNASHARLVVAAIAIAMAVGGALFAIYLLTTVLQPVIIGPDDATKKADDPSSAFGKFVAAHKSALLRSDDDSGAELWNSYHAARAEARRLRDAAGPSADAARADLKRRREQLSRLVWFATFVEVDSRFRRARLSVCFIALAVAAAITVFAWAANPATKSSNAALSVNAQPVAVTLRLNSAGNAAFRSVLGSTCANAAASASGVPAIAISATESSTTVIVGPSSACPDPTEVTVPTEQGSVIAAHPVRPAS